MRIRIATRNSPLALWQARAVRDCLHRARNGLDIELLELLSQGDKSDAPLARIGGKGLFLKELEQALLRGEAELAVHSLKDVPAELPDGLVIAAICARADARDALVCNHFDAAAELPHGARIGTGSLRRQCQLRARFPHLRFADVRGNLGTRLGKLDRGEFDGLVLAAAGLMRLDCAARISETFAPEICLPAPGQGALALECRADDAAMRALAGELHHAPTAACVTAERAVTARLGGDCHAPLAAYAEARDGELRLRALAGSPDGARIVRDEARLTRAQTEAALADGAGTSVIASELGYALADALLARGAAEILAVAHDARAN
ncbi:MAG: hydroxymethylbilane synthase [Gammaproteobacteria bacterium]